uniref:Uncharacterized protein n=1 Tax=Zooxanthella nutricula TaxID=1333877 RepID=A0A7S2QHS5_9DINO
MAAQASDAVAAGASQTSKKMVGPAAVERSAAVQPPTPHTAAKPEVVVANDYTLVGHGQCLDGALQPYESWWAPDYEGSGLTYVNGDPSTCACKACREVCDQHEGCVGYDFYCCPEGVRCIGGALVLFSQNTKPSEAPPEHFSTVGPYGSPPAGGSFTGSGPILSVGDNIVPSGPSRFCYAKNVVGRLGSFMTLPDAPPPVPVAPFPPALRR